MVTKFKSIAKSQVTQLMDQATSPTQPTTTEATETSNDEKPEQPSTETETPTTDTSEQSLKKRLEAFLQTNEEKESLKVI